MILPSNNMPGRLRPYPVIASALLAASAYSGAGCDWRSTWATDQPAKPKYDPVEIMIMARLADLRSTEPEIHKQAVKSLADAGPRAVTKVIPLLGEENSLIRNRAAEVLGRMGPQGREGVPALVGLLKKRNDRDMEPALRAIAQIGPEAGAAVPDLVELIRDKKRPKEHRRLAGKAIIKIGAPAVPTLVPILTSDPDAGFRHAAARALAKMGAAAEPARFALEAARKDPDQKVKFWAKKAIDSMNEAKSPDHSGKTDATAAAEDEDDEEQTAN